MSDTEKGSTPWSSSGGDSKTLRPRQPRVTFVLQNTQQQHNVDPAPATQGGEISQKRMKMLEMRVATLEASFADLLNGALDLAQRLGLG